MSSIFAQLTTKDISILMTMLDRCDDQTGAFAALLRQKVHNATVFFRDDIPADVVTLNSRVTYRMNGEVHGPHIVVPSQGDDFPDYALSIHTLTGLSLLGLAEGEAISFEEEAKRHTVSVQKIEFQPEADLREREMRAIAATMERPTTEQSPQVVLFRPRQKAAVMHVSDDDDPGPFAA